MVLAYWVILSRIRNLFLLTVFIFKTVKLKSTLWGYMRIKLGKYIFGSYQKCSPNISDSLPFRNMIALTFTGSLWWFMRAVCAKPLQSCPALCNPVDHSPPGSSVHGILQARTILQWIAMPSSRGASQFRDQSGFSYISCTGRLYLAFEVVHISSRLQSM